MIDGDLVEDALARVTGELPGGGELRSGQLAMAQAVARAVDGERHLVVQAGTGTGKSLAYLVPIVLSKRTAVIATATKALQDQLAGKDLPHLAATLGQPFSFAVLKGRSNYVCRQRVDELDDDEQLQIEGTRERVEAEVEVLVEWAATTSTGDRAELAVEPSNAAWEKVSVGLRECPGASRCPQGANCFAEAARHRAAEADVIVVNTHLYGIHLAAENAVLPEHDVVVIDEAHQLEEVISNTAGVTLGAGRFSALANAVVAIIDDPQLVADLHASADSLAVALEDSADVAVRPAEVPDLANALLLGQERTQRALDAARKVPKDAGETVTAKALRVTKSASALLDDIAAAFALPDTHVAWVAGGNTPQLRIAPVEVGDLLTEVLWPVTTTILTSATLPVNVADRLGLPADGYDELDVGSPFDFEANAMLYCAADLPDPRSPDYQDAVFAEIERLIVAAGGRTLALFTSWRMMRAAADHLDGRLPWRLLTQGELPKQALLEAFTDDPEASLFATMSFWQGVDIPGRSLSLVIIDRIPFPRPDDPLLQARRDRAGGRAFGAVDLPRAATLLAQGAGRLIRRGDDKGVVAVLDSRLATAKSYRWNLINALPPFRRSSDRDEVEAFLRTLRDSS